MEPNTDSKTDRRFTKVTDQQGNEYVCRIDALKKIDELTEEEKAACFGIPAHGPGA